MLFDMVPSLLLLGNWKPRYESLCSYTPLIFLYFLLISHVFINIYENLNLMCYKMDHFFFLVNMLCLCIDLKSGLALLGT